MARIVRAPEAELDAATIWAYIAEHDLNAAMRMIRRFDAALARLADFPRMGAMRDELFPGLRSFPVGKYLLFYRPTDEGILLLRIIHGAQDVERIFRPDR